MTAIALAPPRFVRRTRLGPNEYRKNFHQIDADIISAVTSAAADQVTPLMSKIYLRLTAAPAEFWEGDGVLYFSAKDEDGHLVKASKVLYACLGVASATAHKALAWMHEQGIIGYFSGKNGAGIRIFLNRAARSIGVRTPAACKKILPFVQGSNGGDAGSNDEPAFNDSFAVSEVLDTDLNPRAPKNGAEKPVVVKTHPDPPPTSPRQSTPSAGSAWATVSQETFAVRIPVDEIVARLSHELEPSILSAARRAAAQEHDRTREWLESRGLPKAARVAQREAYNVLRRYGVIKETVQSMHGDMGRRDPVEPEQQPLSETDVEEMAQACMAMLEVQGQSVEVTLSEMSVAAGGFLLPEDAPRVRTKAEAIAEARIIAGDPIPATLSVTQRSMAGFDGDSR
jgi:CRP-like cAMP-binding protein